MTGSRATGFTYNFLRKHPRIKHLARSMVMAILKVAPEAVAYKARCGIERFVYRSVDHVGELPPIFHYWSHRYLRPILLEHGYDSPDDFFLKEVAAKLGSGHVKILSIASGRAELEISIAQRLKQQASHGFSFHCVDLNSEMLAAAADRIANEGLVDHFSSDSCDLNTLELPSNTYDVVIANQCLHHLTALEHVMAQLSKSLRAGGVLLVSDVIGRNGHQLWPEALQEMQRYWQQLPANLRKDAALGGTPKTYVNYDHSTGGFEGIRSQDVLPCLLDRFDFEMFIAFGCIAIPVVDRRFGWNYDADSAEHRQLIDNLAQRESALLAAGELKPTQLIGKLTPRQVGARIRSPQTERVLEEVLRASV